MKLNKYKLLFERKLILFCIILNLILLISRVSQGESRYLKGDLIDFIINEISIPNLENGTKDQYDPPLDDVLKPIPIFRNVINMLKMGYISSANEFLSSNSIPYDILVFEDETTEHQFLILFEREMLEDGITRITKGWGTYIIDNYNFESNLIIEVPHPHFDGNTWEEGIRVFKALGARAFLLAGSHRYLNEDAKTKGLFPSDVANFGGSEVEAATVFQVVHEELTDPFTHVVQLHGAKERAYTADFIISSGGRFVDNVISWGISPITLKLRDVIESKGDFTAEVFGTEGHTTLGAYGNKQSHYSNKHFGYGRFIHLEQESNIRYENPVDNDGDGKPDDPALPLVNVDKVIDILKSIDWDEESSTFLIDDFSDLKKDGWLVRAENLSPLSPTPVWSCKKFDGKNWLYQKNKVFSNSNYDYELSGSYAFNNGKSWKDSTISCELYSESSGWIGLLFGYIDKDNYFRISLNVKEERWLLVERGEGVIKKIAEGLQAFEKDKSQTVKISTHGYKVNISINDLEVIQHESGNLFVGGVAAYNYASSGSYYTGFCVEGSKAKTSPLILTLDSYYNHENDRINLRLDIPASNSERIFDLFLALCFPPEIWFFPEWSNDIEFFSVKIPSNFSLKRKSILDFEIPVTENFLPPVNKVGQYLTGAGLVAYPGKSDLYISISGFIFE